MNRDERLDRLTERTGALTRGVALAAMHRDYKSRDEARMAKHDQDG